MSIFERTWRREEALALPLLLNFCHWFFRLRQSCASPAGWRSLTSLQFLKSSYILISTFESTSCSHTDYSSHSVTRQLLCNHQTHLFCSLLQTNFSHQASVRHLPKNGLVLIRFWWKPLYIKREGGFGISLSLLLALLKEAFLEHVTVFLATLAGH